MILGSRKWAEWAQLRKKNKDNGALPKSLVRQRCSILLGSPKRHSKICLLELCSWRTRGWSTYFLAPAPHWLRVVPGCIHSLTLADCDLCVDQAAPSELPCRGPKPCSKGDICGWNQSGQDQTHIVKRSWVWSVYREGSFWCLRVHPLFFIEYLLCTSA